MYTHTHRTVHKIASTFRNVFKEGKNVHNIVLANAEKYDHLKCV